MLIRGQTTEQRIGEIANKFSQGLSSYAQSQRQEAGDLKEERLYNDSLAIKKAELEQKKLERQRAFDQDERAKEVHAATMKEKEAKLLELSKPIELTRDYKKSMAVAGLKAQTKADEKAAERSNPTYKLEKLGAEGRSKVGALTSGFQALDQMTKASADGFGPEHIDSSTPLVGRLISDTPYSEAERTVTEVIGRLQSGGAMSENEVKTFKSLGPRPGDDGPTKTRKLAQQKDFLQNKMTAFGLSDADIGQLGFKTTSDYKPRNSVEQSVGTQQAAPSKAPWEKYKK